MVVPTILKKIYRRLKTFNKEEFREFTGNYRTWDDVNAVSGKLQPNTFFKKLYEASRLVKDGIAVYERDSVIFDKVEHNWPLLSCLLNAILNKRKQTFRILDFGGSLGTTYSAVRKFIPANIHLQWVIVEQREFTKVGKAEFENNELTFEYDLNTVFNKGEVDLVLLSGVLQYLPNMIELFTQLSNYGVSHLVIDRTLFIDDYNDRLVVQHVPAYIDKASYSCCLLNEKKLVENLEALNYTPFVNFNSQYDPLTYSEDAKRIYYKGFYFLR